MYEKTRKQGMNMKNEQINIRDPFVVYENGKYEPVYGRLGGTVWLLDKEKNFEMSPVDKESLNR